MASKKVTHPKYKKPLVGIVVSNALLCISATLKIERPENMCLLDMLSEAPIRIENIMVNMDSYVWSLTYTWRLWASQVPCNNENCVAYHSNWDIWHKTISSILKQCIRFRKILDKSVHTFNHSYNNGKNLMLIFMDIGNIVISTVVQDPGLAWSGSGHCVWPHRIWMYLFQYCVFFITERQRVRRAHYLL